MNFLNRLKLRPNSPTPRTRRHGRIGRTTYPRYKPSQSLNWFFALSLCAQHLPEIPAPELIGPAFAARIAKALWFAPAPSLAPLKETLIAIGRTRRARSSAPGPSIQPRFPETLRFETANSVCKRPPRQARISVTHYSHARCSSLSPSLSFRTLRQRYVPRPARSTAHRVTRIARVTCTEGQVTPHPRSHSVAAQLPFLPALHS